MFQAGYPLTKRLLNFVYKVSTLSLSIFLSSTTLINTIYQVIDNVGCAAT